MIRCIAIDDEPLALKLLSRYCGQIPSIHLLGTYTDPVEGIAYIKAMKPDLLFLDIQMPDLSGMDIAASVDKNMLVIFTTAYKQYAVEGFELDVVDYLLKPFDFDRFMKACLKAEERFLNTQTKSTLQTVSKETISFKHNYQTIQLALDAILYIEASDNYVKIVTPDEMFLPVMTLKNIQTLLPETKFIRIHKSYIIPVNKIKSFNREKVVTDTIQIPIGRAYYKNFMEKIKSIN